jgi:hypothetical protein
MSHNSDQPSQVVPIRDNVDEAILKAVRNIRFGSVEITVHDSNVVQIESKEKIRFEPRRARK